MTSPTHREFAIVGACVGTIALQELNINPVMSKNNIILAYATLFIVNYVFGQEGAKWSDLDHLWKNIKEKTALNKMISSLIHLTGHGHRNPVTHSFDIWLISYIFLVGATKWFVAYAVLQDMIVMLLTAFYVGYLTHLVADAFSMNGTRFFFWNNKLRLYLVPKSGRIDKSIPATMFMITVIAGVIAWQFISIVMSLQILGIGLVMSYFIYKMSGITFKTGLDFNDPNNWETMVYNAVHKMTYVGLIAVILYGVLLVNPELKESINFSIELPTIKDVINGIINMPQNIAGKIIK